MMPDGTRSEENHYWPTSLEPDADRLLALCRGHCGVENQCHWVMAVTWGEDASRIRRSHAARNIALLCRLAHTESLHDVIAPYGYKWPEPDPAEEAARLLGVRLQREAPERAIGSDRRAVK